MFDRDTVRDLYNSMKGDILQDEEKTRYVHEHKEELASFIGRVHSVGSDGYFELIWSATQEGGREQFGRVIVAAIASHDIATGEDTISRLGL